MKALDLVVLIKTTTTTIIIIIIISQQKFEAVTGLGNSYFVYLPGTI
jgi:hypothetical protein